MAVGRWWKFTSDQLHDGSRTEAQCLNFQKGFLWFLFIIRVIREICVQN